MLQERRCFAGSPSFMMLTQLRIAIEPVCEWMLVAMETLMFSTVPKSTSGCRQGKTAVELVLGWLASWLQCWKTQSFQTHHLQFWTFSKSFTRELLSFNASKAPGSSAWSSLSWLQPARCCGDQVAPKKAESVLHTYSDSRKPHNTRSRAVLWTTMEHGYGRQIAALVSLRFLIASDWLPLYLPRYSGRAFSDSPDYFVHKSVPL